MSFLDEIFTRFDKLTAKYGLDKIKTIGDAYMVVGGLAGDRLNYVEAMGGHGAGDHGAGDGEPMRNCGGWRCSSTWASRPARRSRA